MGRADADADAGHGRVELGVLALAVPPQVDFALESASAVVARERLVARVFARVRDQVRRLAERLTANGAFVRLFTFNLKKNEIHKLMYE